MNEDSRLHDPQFHMNVFGIRDEESRLLALYWQLHTVAEDDWLPFDLERWASAMNVSLDAARMAVRNLINLQLIVREQSGEKGTRISVSDKYFARLNELIHEEPAQKTAKPRKASFKRCLQVAGYETAAIMLFKLQALYLTDQKRYIRNGVRCVGYSQQEFAEMLCKDGEAIKARTVKLALHRLYKSSLLARKRHKKAGAPVMHYRLTGKCIDALGVDITKCPDAAEKVSGWQYYEAEQPAANADNDNVANSPIAAAA